MIVSTAAAAGQLLLGEGKWSAADGDGGGGCGEVGKDKVLTGYM